MSDLFRDHLIEVEAIERHQRHVSHPSHRPLSEGYERVGLIGEAEFGRRFNLEVDTSTRPNGDDGRDFHLTLETKRGGSRTFIIDVKTARKPYNLIVEQGKVRPLAIYVLAGAVEGLLGWEWGIVVLRAPIKDFGYGVMNHYIPRARLRSIDELIERRR